MGNDFEGLMFPVKGTVLTPCGDSCPAPHQEGETWLLRGVPPGICSFAFNAMFPAYWTLHFGGNDPFEENPDQIHVSCSISGCGARFLVERIEDQEAAELQAIAETVTIEDLAQKFPSGLSKKVN